MQNTKTYRQYLSVIFLFVPAVLFGLLLFLYKDNTKLHITSEFPYLPWQFFGITVFGLIATLGGLMNFRWSLTKLSIPL